MEKRISMHLHKVQWSEDVIKADPFFGRSGFDSACPPGFRTQLHVTTSLSTRGGPVSYLQLSEGGLQVVYPLGCGPGSPELSKSDLDMASK